MFLMKFLDDWEKYVHKEEKDTLVQLAIVHAQFEIIHPFLDGNGRIGRILIPLFLFEKKMLSRPIFYLSSYLESNRNKYYSSLLSISQKGDWQGWINFFLKAIITQAKENSERTKLVKGLYERMKQKIVEITHSQYALAALDSLFDRPIFSTTNFIDRSNIQKQTAMLILRRLKDNKIIRVYRESSGRKPAILIFPKLINIVEGRDDF
jgi:Fic family protein